MRDQGELFSTRLNRELSMRLRDTGMASAAAARAVPLETLRGIAESIALTRSSRQCNADDVQQHLVDNQINISKGPSWGSIFKGNQWEFTGIRIPSALPANHGRELKVWRLKRNEAYL